MLLAYLGFVSLGLPDAVAGVAWPSVRNRFELPQHGLGFVMIALGCGYCTSSFLGGKLTQLMGVGTLLTVSSLLVAVAMLGNALSPAFEVFVACAVIWGLGSGAIDAGLNAYAASHFSARHVNFLHAFYSLGATIGPLLMTAILVHANSWRLGYALIGGIVFLMTLAFLITRRRWDDPGTATTETAEPISLRAALRHPLVRLQTAIFFVYTGLEFLVGQWAFTLLTESRHVRIDVAGALTGGYFAAIGVGRALFGFVVEHIGVDRLVRLSTLLAVLGATLFAFGTPVEVSFVGLALIGLGLAPVFPCLMSRTPQRLGADHAAHAVGFQVAAAMLGVAVVPTLAGMIAEREGLETVAFGALILAAVLWGLHELLHFRTKLRP